MSWWLPHHFTITKRAIYSVPVSVLCLHTLPHFKHLSNSMRWLSSYRWGNRGLTSIQFTEGIRQVNVRTKMWAWVCLLQATCRLSLLPFLTEGETWMTPSNFYIERLRKGFISLRTRGVFSPSWMEKLSLHILKGQNHSQKLNYKLITLRET